MTTHEILALKCAADQEVGALKFRLDQCGPRGNRSVEQRLDYWRGRSDALRDVLRLQHAEMDRIAAEVGV